MATISLEASSSAAGEHREKALKALSKLPAFSPTLTRLMALLADEDVSYAALSELIEKDAVLAGNVLRMVNSALYARRGTVSSVRHAVSILGVNKLKNTALSMSLLRMWGEQGSRAEWSATRFNLHSAASAILADLVAAEVTVEYPEGAFVAGLLQNVGMMVIAVGLPEMYTRIQNYYLEAPARLLVDAERRYLALDHAEISGLTTKYWNLPAPIQEAVAAHHEPGPGTLASVVRAADILAEQMGIVAQSWHRAAPGEAQETLGQLGLSGRAGALMESFQAEFELIRKFF